MRWRWWKHPSMLARLSAVFCALVAIPLAVTGGVLSLVGHHTVTRSTSELTRAGEEAVDSTRRRFQSLVSRGMSDAAREIEQIGSSALLAAGQQHTTFSTRILTRATDDLIAGANQAFTRASNRITERGNQLVRTARVTLEQLHKQSLEDLAAVYLNQVRSNLAPVKESFRREVADTLRKVTAELVSQRVTRIVLAAQRGVDDVSVRLHWTSFYPTISDFDPNSSPEKLRELLSDRQRGRTELPIVRAILVNDEGYELRREPANEPRENWRERPEWRSLQDPQPEAQRSAVRMPFALVPGGRPTLRLCQPVYYQGVPDDSRGVGALIVDIDLRDIVRRAFLRQQPPPDDVALLVNGEGWVISATDTRLIGEQIAALRPALRQAELLDRRNVPNPYSFDYRHTNDRAMRAAAQLWLDDDPEQSSDNLYAVYATPEEVALEPADAVYRHAEASLTVALGDLERRVEERRARSIEAVESKQAEIIQQLRTALREEVDRAQSSYRQRLEAKRNEVLASARQRFPQGSRSVLVGPLDEIRQRTRQLIQRTRTQLDQSAGQDVEQISALLRHSAREIAVRSARNISVSTAALAGMFLIVALMIAVLTARSLVRPIKSVLRGTLAIAAGNYSERISVALLQLGWRAPSTTWPPRSSARKPSCSRATTTSPPSRCASRRSFRTAPTVSSSSSRTVESA